MPGDHRARERRAAAGEFREVIDQQRVGVPLAEALERLAMRMPLPEVRFLAIVIAIQQQAGGNLSEALGNLVRRSARPLPDWR